MNSATMKDMVYKGAQAKILGVCADAENVASYRCNR
jgi:hypothetical protein